MYQSDRFCRDVATIAWQLCRASNSSLECPKRRSALPDIRHTKPGAMVNTTEHGSECNPGRSRPDTAPNKPVSHVKRKIVRASC